MKMLYMFVLLVLCTDAIAQPLEGPFTVFEFDSARVVGKHRLVIGNNDTAYVFFENHPVGQTTVVSWTVYSLTSRELLRSVEPLGETISWQHELHDAMTLANGGCAATVYRTIPADSQISETILYNLSVAGVSNANVLYRGYHIYPCWFSCFDLINTRLTHRIGGGYLVVGAEAMRFQHGYDETDFWPTFWAFPVGNNSPDWQCGINPGSIFGSDNNWCLSLAPDTMLLFSAGFGGSDNRLVRYSPSESGNTLTQIECTLNLVGFTRTSGGRLLVASCNEYQAERNGMFELSESGSCSTLGEFGFTINAEAIALHPGFGFAALTRESSGLTLVRFDTNGVEAASRGIIYWPETNYEVVSSYCTIASNGKVFVQCMEHSFAIPSHYRLRVASVGWTNALGASDHNFILPPSSFILSTFPNPFNPITHLSFDLPHSGKVTLQVFDLLGRETARLIDETREAGTHRAVWNAQAQPSGIYFARLTSPDGIRTIKLCLTK